MIDLTVAEMDTQNKFEFNIRRRVFDPARSMVPETISEQIRIAFPSRIPGGIVLAFENSFSRAMADRSSFDAMWRPEE